MSANREQFDLQKTGIFTEIHNANNRHFYTHTEVLSILHLEFCVVNRVDSSKILFA
jgi:hypothetical protein